MAAWRRPKRRTMSNDPIRNGDVEWHANYDGAVGSGRFRDDALVDMVAEMDDDALAELDGDVDVEFVRAVDVEAVMRPPEGRDVQRLHVDAAEVEERLVYPVAAADLRSIGDNQARAATAARNAVSLAKTKEAERGCSR